MANLPQLLFFIMLLTAIERRVKPWLDRDEKLLSLAVASLAVLLPTGWCWLVRRVRSVADGRRRRRELHQERKSTLAAMEAKTKRAKREVAALEEGLKATVSGRGILEGWAARCSSQDLSKTLRLLSGALDDAIVSIDSVLSGGDHAIKRQKKGLSTSIVDLMSRVDRLVAFYNSMSDDTVTE
jgi:hypothetical protein